MLKWLRGVFGHRPKVCAEKERREPELSQRSPRRVTLRDLQDSDLYVPGPQHQYKTYRMPRPHKSKLPRVPKS